MPRAACRAPGCFSGIGWVGKKFAPGGDCDGAWLVGLEGRPWILRRPAALPRRGHSFSRRRGQGAPGEVVGYAWKAVLQGQMSSSGGKSRISNNRHSCAWRDSTVLYSRCGNGGSKWDAWWGMPSQEGGGNGLLANRCMVGSCRVDGGWWEEGESSSGERRKIRGGRLPLAAHHSEELTNGLHLDPARRTFSYERGGAAFWALC